MIAWLLLVGIGVLLTIVLIMPITLSLSTARKDLSLSWGGFVKASASLLQDDIELRFSLLGLSRRMSLLEMAAKKADKKSASEKPNSNHSDNTRKRIPAHLALAVVKSFVIKQFYVNVDLGSVYYNAWFYPLGQILERKNFYLSTNFEGKTEIDIIIYNYPGRLLWVVFKSLLKNKTI
jgi:hypothetical protein